MVKANISSIIKDASILRTVTGSAEEPNTLNTKPKFLAADTSAASSGDCALYDSFPMQRERGIEIERKKHNRKSKDIFSPQ